MPYYYGKIRGMNVYKTLKKPIISLAPMEDVTDTVFRQVIASIQTPDLFYTEFVNVDGINSQGRDSVMQRLRYDESEKPLIAQLWGSNPNNYFYVSHMIKGMGFDGIDINMGCSVKKVISKCNGSGMINEDRGYVKEIIEAVKQGAQGLPVSVKTRLGWDDYDLEWIKFLLEQDLDALTLHCRTAIGFKSKELAWSKILPCIKLRDELGKDTLIFGNGGIQSLSDAYKHTEKYGVDGIMIGRAAMDNPWLFADRRDVAVSESYEMFKKHILLFERVWGDTKNFSMLKKFVKSYVSSFAGSQEIRARLMSTNTLKELLNQVEDLI